MALSPIQLFRNDQTSLAQILSGQSQTISGIMDRAIQIGRDISNRQTAQERDLIGMRQQQQALDQRRGESLQQDYEDTRRFLRGAFESDRRFGLEQEREERMDAAQLFGQQSERDRIGIAREGLQLRKDEAEAERISREASQEAARAEREQLRQALGTGEPAIPEEESAPSPASLLLPPRRRFDAGMDGVVDVGETELPPLVVEGKRDTDRASKLERLGALEIGIKSDTLTTAEKARYNAEYTRLKDELESSEEAGTGDTPAGRRAEESLQMRKQSAAEKRAAERMEGYVTDTQAFVPPSVWMLNSVGGDKDKLTPEQLAEAGAYADNPVAAEREYARNAPSEDAYVNKVRGLSEAQRQKRREFYWWSHDMSPSPAGTGTSAVDAIPGI